MAGADLERVVDMLRSERMEEQFRMLRAGNLLAELRSAVSVVHGNGTVSKGANLRLMFCIQSLAAPLRELLDAMLHTKVRADEWHQVPVVLVRNRRFRLTTLRDLKQLSHKFSALASHIKQVHTNHIPMRDGSSSHNIGVHAPVDALAARMVGRSELLEKMVSIVLCERTAHSGGLLFMPIIGGPGIGKTRLAMALLGDYRVRRKFAVRLAVPVIRHRQFCLERVLMLKITPERKHSNVEGNPHAMASHITRKLSGVDYLIVLDDVWSDKEGTCPEIGALMKALPPRGSLVITTRTPDVATYLETLADVTVTSKPFFLRPLEEHFSSSFVAEWTAAYPGDWPSELSREAGMMIAQKCEGVPSLLYYARTCFCQQQGRKFWQGFLEQSGNKARTGFYFWRELLACINDLPHDKFWQRFLRHSSELPDGNSVLESGSVSYQHLPSEMRSCLLYCSMFPSGYEFDPEELTDLLAAEGYIPPMVGNAQRKRFVQKLLDECFYPLQEHKHGDKCTYMMHKVLHIFAQNTDRKTSLVIKADQATQLTSNAEHAEGSLAIRRASLIVSPLDASIPASLLRCRDLGALILLQEGPMCPPDAPRCEISEIPQEFLQSSKHIQALSFRGTKIRMLPTKFLEPHLMKYLNLSQTDIENIPSSISRLMLLQTLVLSYCDKLQKLHPNMTKLAQLQKLDLEGCFNLVELPRDLSKMKRLEFLNVTECSSLTQLPRRMGEMKSLQTLLGYIASPTDGSSVTELLSLENLHRLSLQCLQKVSDILDVRYARLDYKTNLESLSLRWDVDDNSDDSVPAHAVLESLQPHRRLKALEILAYKGQTLPSWMTTIEPYLVSLVEIRLINLTSCEKVLAPLGLLPTLKIAEISGNESIRNISDNLYGHRGRFPSLEKLIFSHMPNFEIWEEEHRPGMFPRLTELTIIQCPKLRALHMELPSLEKLVFWMNNKVLYDLKGALRGPAKTLEHMSISFCQELLASSDCEALQDLCKLRKLEMCGCDELTCLPQGFHYLTSIRSLTIDSCSKLETLPDWLKSLPSLQIMRLSGCPLLQSIPEGLQQRPGFITYVEDCPSLLEQPIPRSPAEPTGKRAAARVNKGKEIVVEDE